MAAGTVTITGTLVNPAGVAQSGAVVIAQRFQDKATATALSAAGVGTSTTFKATTNGSGVFSIACTHLEAHVAPLTYKILFPDNRYALVQMTVADNGTTINLGTIPQYAIPVSADGVNITSLVQRSLSQSAVGYGTGQGGTVTQLTSKATGVTLSKQCGAITLNNAALAAGTIVSFVLTNTTISATDVLVLNHISGGTMGSYTLNARAAAGSATIDVRNNTAGSLGDAIVIQFAVIHAVNS
jgi:hypothetical protein